MGARKLTPKPLKKSTAPARKAPGKFITNFPKYPAFFKKLNSTISPGPLRENQVDGIVYILDEWVKTDHTDLRWLAYMLATAWHETMYAMKPVTEYGSNNYLRGKPYWPFIGRGYVQLTWKVNYQKYGIASDPEKALEPAIAAHIMLDGMVNGVFTGKKLSAYFSDKKNDPINARRVINGTDCATMIAGYHRKFLTALQGEDPHTLV
jgi:hypothetical protein